MTHKFISLDKEGKEVYICKICKRWIKRKDYHLSIRSCKRCIQPYLEKENI